MLKAEGWSDRHQISPHENNPNHEEGIIMLRELPEPELSDNSDYERWYFEGQRAAWEAAGKEVHKVKEQRKTERALFLSGRHEKRDDDMPSST